MEGFVYLCYVSTLLGRVKYGSWYSLHVQAVESAVVKLKLAVLILDLDRSCLLASRNNEIAYELLTKSVIELYHCRLAFEHLILCLKLQWTG